MELKNERFVWNDDDRDTSDIYDIYKKHELITDEEYIPVYKIIKQLYDDDKYGLYIQNIDCESNFNLKHDEYLSDYSHDYSDNDELEDDINFEDYYINDEFYDKTESYNNEIYDKLIYDKFHYY